ncbi:MAG: hypothetical protein RIR26_1719 [Pseudomonadota bacterium]
MENSHVWTVRDVLNWTSQKFAGLELPTPLLDAQLLIGSVLSLSKVQIYTQLDRPLIPLERAQLRELVRRRLLGEPVAYLLNQKSWHNLDLFVDKRVLVPRPETETLLDVVLAISRSSSQKPNRILDLCTGSGCLAIALAKSFPEAQVDAVDVSAEALEIAKLNATRNEVSNVVFHQGDATSADFLTSLRSDSEFEFVVSNPPYVSEAEWLECDPSVRDFEPKLALVGGQRGWDMPAQLLNALTAAGILSHAKIVGLELGVTHPSVLAETLLPELTPEWCAQPWTEFSCQRPAWEFPTQQWFAVRDYAQQSRFLFLRRA